VFVRRDEAKPPLAAAYAGPYQVFERSTSFFRLQVGEKEDIVATHRLKPAFLPPDAQPASPWPPPDRSAAGPCCCSPLCTSPRPSYAPHGTFPAPWPAFAAAAYVVSSCPPPLPSRSFSVFLVSLQDWGESVIDIISFVCNGDSQCRLCFYLVILCMCLSAHS
jgi:hypothetical protein